MPRPSPTGSLRLQRSTVPIALLLLGLSGLLACESVPGMTTPPQPALPWDQSVVTGLAGQLAMATETAYTAVRQAPARFEAGTQSASVSMAESLRQMHEESRGLHGQLEAGETMADTMSQYGRVKELFRDVQHSAGFTDGGTSQISALGAVANLLNQLDGFYGAQ